MDIPGSACKSFQYGQLIGPHLHTRHTLLRQHLTSTKAWAVRTYVHAREAHWARDAGRQTSRRATSIDEFAGQQPITIQTCKCIPDKHPIGTRRYASLNAWQRKCVFAKGWRIDILDAAGQCDWVAKKLSCIDAGQLAESQIDDAFR